VAASAASEAGRGVLRNAGRAAGVSYRLGLYDDPEALLPPFRPEEFHRRLAWEGAPKMVAQLATGSGEGLSGLYRRFQAGPHFRPWFHRRRRAAAAQLRAVCRDLTMATSPGDLVAGLMGPGGDHVGAADLVPLLVRVRARRAQELAREPRDLEYICQMEAHQKAVENVLPSVLVEAVEEAYSTPRLPLSGGSGHRHGNLGDEEWEQI